MVKRKKRIIMYMILVVMMTIGLGKIGAVVLAENQETVEKQNSNVSAVSETPTPDKYFILEEIPGKPSERSITFNEDATPAITEVVIPKKINGYTITRIGNYAFSHTGLTTITIPDSVTSIGSSAFRGCTSLTTVTIAEGLTSIESYAFNECTNLTSITIPYGVEKIERGTFSGCSQLTTINLPETVTSIGGTAFGNTGLTTITIPKKVTSIEDYTFHQCSSLKTVAVHDTLTSISSTAFGYESNFSPVNNLIFICQDIDDMKIADEVVTNIPDNINVCRIAADKEIKTDYSEIKSYEWIGQTLSVEDIFKDRSGMIYIGETGTDEYTGVDIKLEDYFDMTLEYELLGNPESDNTKLEDDGVLQIGADESLEDLKIMAKTTDLVKEIDIKIMKVQSVEMKNEPENTYYADEEYKPEGLTITVTYEDKEDIIEYSEENKNDFTFASNPLTFGTKEQVITYKGYEMKQSLIIYGNKILKESNVEVRGMFTYDSLLDVEKTEIDNDLKYKEIIAGYELSVANGSYRDPLTIIFHVGDKYNGKKVNIRHKGNSIEEFEKAVSEGKVTIEVDNLSPFIIYTEKEIVEEPETPIIPEPNEPNKPTPEIPDEPVPEIPIIKPIQPIPDKPIIRPDTQIPNKPIQTQPSQNQQNTVSTEDNNHLLLWGVLGIAGISVALISIKKKS